MWFNVVIDKSVSLVGLFGCIYLNLNYTMSVFSLPLNHQRSSNSLRYPAYNHISISHVSLLLS
jgi:hypothetical protein